jgi:hypothetical protein
MGALEKKLGRVFNSSKISVVRIDRILLLISNALKI